MKNNFKKIGIIFNKDMPQTIAVSELIHSKIENSTVFEINEMKKEVDLAVAIGGDGSLLRCSRFYSEYDIPILGFNVGRLGYLTQANPTEVDEVIKKLQNSSYKIENRIMLKSGANIALNDIVIKGASCTRSDTFDLFINDKSICSYVADGIIVSTPTGSTAYSLSAGGPIVSPKLDCFLIIPICAHTLNARPIVIPTNEKITIKTREENHSLNVSFDGQVELKIKNEIVIQKNEKQTKLLILNRQKDIFYDILKEKLHWSLPPKKI